jgi:RNase adaptor protein for sRNA GlmZ degradation
MEIMVDLIEEKDLHVIGINCSKGKHRSVTCAIILKQYFYPKSDIHFLELR